MPCTNCSNHKDCTYCPDCGTLLKQTLFDIIGTDCTKKILDNCTNEEYVYKFSFTDNRPGKNKRPQKEYKLELVLRLFKRKYIKNGSYDELIEEFRTISDPLYIMENVLLIGSKGGFFNLNLKKTDIDLPEFICRRKNMRGEEYFEFLQPCSPLLDYF